MALRGRSLGVGLEPSGVKALQQGAPRHTEGFRDVTQLDEIDPSFTRFVLADEGLGLAEPLRDIHLAQACFVP